MASRANLVEQQLVSGASQVACAQCRLAQAAPRMLALR